MSNLFIVESPAKAKTIEKYLGKKFKVVASMGHIRDLPKSQFGVDIENEFEPKYIPIRGKSALIKSLKTEVKKADMVYLATDPDREGEAISWHLSALLGLNETNCKRVVFNEITKTALKEAVSHPRFIDQNLVDAQQARRILDRIVGYKLSPFLWRKIKKGLSAGRVQSVATAMIVDRENEIRAFVPREYWSLNATFENPTNSQTIPAKFFGDNNGSIEPENQAQATEIYNKIIDGTFTVTDVKKTIKMKNPSPPFITSTLQQELSRRYNFQTRRTMRAAQDLYEGVNIKGHGLVGLITYMRTDSLRISDDFAKAAENYIINKYGMEFYPEKRRIFKTKKSAQDAHEAIRPTNLELTPEVVKGSLSDDQFKVYKLIFNRFIASQMSKALYNTISADISEGNYLFKATCQSVKFKGFTVVYSDLSDNEEAGMFELKKGNTLTLQTLNKEQHFTQPPSRYTEGTLTKALEENGIGRPSTFVPIITTIIAREYVQRDGKLLKPTILGEITTQLMKDHFEKIINYDFSAELENELDKIQDGDLEWRKAISDFYSLFEQSLSVAEEALKEKQFKVPDEVTDEICPNCGKNLVIKNSRFGKFLACPAYPECKFTKPIVFDTGAACPKCGGRILKKKSKNRKIYYGCEKFPDCDFMSWDEPSKDKCQKCGANLFKRGNSKSFYCHTANCSSGIPSNTDKKEQ